MRYTRVYAIFVFKIRQNNIIASFLETRSYSLVKNQYIYTDGARCKKPIDVTERTPKTYLLHFIYYRGRHLGVGRLCAIEYSVRSHVLGIKI